MEKKFLATKSSGIRHRDCPSGVHRAGRGLGAFPGTIYWPPIYSPPTPDTPSEGSAYFPLHPGTNCTKMPRNPSPDTGSNSTGEIRSPHRPRRPSCKSWKWPVDRPDLSQSNGRRICPGRWSSPDEANRVHQCRNCSLAVARPVGCRDSWRGPSVGSLYGVPDRRTLPKTL